MLWLRMLLLAVLFVCDCVDVVGVFVGYVAVVVIHNVIVIGCYVVVGCGCCVGVVVVVVVVVVV